jgi:ribosomal protein L28
MLRLPINYGVPLKKLTEQAAHDFSHSLRITKRFIAPSLLKKAILVAEYGLENIKVIRHC